MVIDEKGSAVKIEPGGVGDRIQFENDVFQGSALLFLKILEKG